MRPKRIICKLSMVMINHLKLKLSCCYILENGTDTDVFKVSAPLKTGKLKESNYRFLRQNPRQFYHEFNSFS